MPSYYKICRSPILTRWHNDTLVQWERNYMNWIDKWSSVLFSDTDKFNLEAPIFEHITCMIFSRYHKLFQKTIRRELTHDVGSILI